MWYVIEALKALVLILLVQDCGRDRECGGCEGLRVHIGRGCGRRAGDEVGGTLSQPQGLESQPLFQMVIPMA